MRLLDQEKRAIKEILHSYCISSEIYLHGSRIDDSLKGGDIDLFWVVSKQDYQELILKKHHVLGDLSRSLREQRVDLTLISDESVDTDNFFQSSQKVKL